METMLSIPEPRSHKKMDDLNRSTASLLPRTVAPPQPKRGLAAGRSSS